ncbi:transmembrane protein 161-like emei [Rhynchophorus ferrugineus]|uniref:transmembrane protein 161-like emei n=1 Tax=Rhynchophorus ferrugineus TaxID=354439 RepID=UPI003FCD7BC6
MALLGAQLVITLIMISVIQKLGPHFSLAKWFLCSTGLIRYLYPTNDELRQLANIPKDRSKAKKGNKNSQNGKNVPDTFHIDRSLDVQLETAKISHLDVVLLKFYNEYQWLVDFSLYTSMVYFLTEVYQIWFPIKDEVNLSMVWCFLVILFALKFLLSLTVQYFKGEESVGERSTCIVMGFMYLLIAMIVLIVDENTLELGLETAYTSFNQSASQFLSKQGLNSSGPASKIFIKFCIAVWCAILGAVLTFPGMRIAKMHWDLLRYFRESKLKQMLLNISFALPFILVILWIKPIAKDYLTVRIFSGRNTPLLTEGTFEILRLLIVISTIIIKICLMPWYLQAYLDMAYHRTEEQKKEAGRITNIEFQKKIAAVFYYLCVVTLQYLAPLILCLYLTLMYKTLGEYQWFWLIRSDASNGTSVNDELNVTVKESMTGQDPTEDLYLTLDSLKSIFGVKVFRGVFGFATWWSCFTYFATTSVGLIYQSYFSTK